jgi:hypothetical protein
MNAIQPSRSRPHLQPVKSRPRATKRAARQRRQRSYQVLATETTLKLAVNLTLSLVAVGGLLQLWPTNRTGEEKLQQIQAEVKLTEGRVSELQAAFTSAFDPQQGKTLMQQQSYRTDPTVLPVIFLEHPSTESEEFPDRPANSPKF